MHTTNYTNTFIEIADDCKVDVGMAPPEKQQKTIARMQFEMLHDNPYHYTSDDLLFAIYALRNGVGESEREAQKAEFFSKGQPCMRSSPLGKTYGWGIHFDEDSKIAIYARESDEYARWQNESSLKHVKAMKSSR